MSGLDRLRDKLLHNPETWIGYERLRPQYEVMADAIHYREAAGLSQAQLAARMGKQQPAIARFEAARVQPSIAFLQQLAEALDLKLVVRLEPRSPASDRSANANEAGTEQSLESVREKTSA